MRLSKEDKELLHSWGFKDQDFGQIEEALRADKTSYELENCRISRKQAIEVLGMRKFLSGIARSAFHWSAARETSDGKVVYFDSRKLFK
nr:hypothetical protein [uncultured Oscillibacter sp.]